MRRKAFSIVLLFFLNAAAIKVIGQETAKPITLDEVIASAVTNNRAVQLAKQDESIASSNFKQTEAVFLPQVGLSYTAMSTNNPLNAFGFKLQQKSITQMDFNPDLLNHPSGTPDFTTKVEVMQPLVNMDALYMRKGAQKQIEIYQLKTQRTKEYITFEAQRAYLQLQLAYDAVKVLEEALETTKAVYKFTDDHYKQGLIQQSDVLNVQVQVATIETNLATAKSNIKNASDYISLLMGVPTGTVYSVDSNVATAISGNDTIVTVPATRADFVAMQRAIDASNLMIQSSKMSYLPRLNAFGSYQLNDSRMLGFGANAYLAGVQLSWDIFKGNRTKNTITTQTLERNKLSAQLAQQQEQSSLELNKTRRDIANAQYEISQHKTAIEQATESLRILRNRYEQGLVNTTDVMMATTQLSQQKLALAQATCNQQISKAYLQLLTTSVNK
ncbi:MAG: TolC family protein [Bacteroidota bacterium]|nr:TolC family protein [Bacteroidota bacterium]